MKHERIYFTCEGCGNDLPEEGHTEVRAVYTGHIEPTVNDGKVWELCAQCWLKVFSVLDTEDLKRRQNSEAAQRLRGSARLDEELDEYRPWDL